MAGDHKCPVCSSTFTRPQHVARHMRSHTGDRPYKCQHCGDAFARSDLLSRHVNKCHSAEKAAAIAAAEAAGIPLKSKKGRGSKTACDQCTIERSVCNSGEPCAKCLTKGIKCTYNQIPTNLPSASRARQVPSSSSIDYNNIALNSYLPPDPSAGGIAGAAREARFDLMRRAAMPPGQGSGITDDSILYGSYRNPYMRSDTELPFRYHPDLLPQFNNFPPLPPVHQTTLPTVPPIYHPSEATGAIPDARPATSGEGFSSAFGLMSLEDPNVLAGLTEHQPFFDAEAQNLYNSEQLKSYYNNMHTSGSPTDMSTFGKRMRRASLPAIKTPPEFMEHRGPPNAFPLPPYAPSRDPAPPPPGAPGAPPAHPGYAQSQMRPDELKAYEEAVLSRGGDKFRLDSSHLPRRSRTIGHGGPQNQHQGYNYQPSNGTSPQAGASYHYSGRPVLPPGRNPPFIGPPGGSTFSPELPVGHGDTSGSSTASPAMRVDSAQSNHLQQSPASVAIRGMRNPSTADNHTSSLPPPQQQGLTLPIGPQIPKRPVPKRNASQTLEQEVQKSLKSSNNPGSTADSGGMSGAGFGGEFDFLYHPTTLDRNIRPGAHGTAGGLSMGSVDPFYGTGMNPHSVAPIGNDRPRRSLSGEDSNESASHSASASVSASASAVSRPSTAQSQKSYGQHQVQQVAQSQTIESSPTRRTAAIGGGATSMPLSMSIANTSSDIRNAPLPGQGMIPPQPMSLSYAETR